MYWSCRAQEAFKVLRSTGKESQLPSLTDIFKEAFTVYDSPIWQDTSTTAQCREMEEFLGLPEQQQDSLLSVKESIRLCGQQRLAELTGSRAYERYTGSQILKVSFQRKWLGAQSAHLGYTPDRALTRLLPSLVACSRSCKRTQRYTRRLNESLL